MQNMCYMNGQAPSRHGVLWYMTVWHIWLYKNLKNINVMNTAMKSAWHLGLNYQPSPYPEHTNPPRNHRYIHNFSGHTSSSKQACWARQQQIFRKKQMWKWERVLFLPHLFFFSIPFIHFIWFQLLPLFFFIYIYLYVPLSVWMCVGLACWFFFLLLIPFGRKAVSALFFSLRTHF